MSDNPVVSMLRQVKQYFDRSTACLDEEDSGFAPRQGMFTAAQQVAHVAQTVEWFVHGAFATVGFETDFEALDRKVRGVTSLAEARAWLDRAFEQAFERLGSATPKELAAPIAPGPVLGGEPRSVISPGIAEHTAHHRGALTVYARLRGKTPALPYG